jgi:hypothetical protein
MKIKVSTPTKRYPSQPTKGVVIAVDPTLSVIDFVDEGKNALSKKTVKLAFLEINRERQLSWANIRHITRVSDLGLCNADSVLFVFDNQYVEPRDPVEDRNAAQEARKSIPEVLKAQEKLRKMAKAGERERDRKRKERAEERAKNDKFQGEGRTMGGRVVRASSTTRRHNPATAVMHGEGRRVSDGKVMIKGEPKGEDEIMNKMVQNIRRSDPTNLLVDHNERLFNSLRSKAGKQLLKQGVLQRADEERIRLIETCLRYGAYSFEEGVLKGNVLGGEDLNGQGNWYTVRLQPPDKKIFTGDRQQMLECLQFEVVIMKLPILKELAHNFIRTTPDLFQPNAMLRIRGMETVLWSFVFHANQKKFREGTVKDFYMAVTPREDWSWIEEPEKQRKIYLSQKAQENKRQMDVQK